MPIMEISVVPIGTKGPSVSEYVAGIVKILEKEKNINYKLGAMSTTIEADSVEKLFHVARKIHQLPFEQGVKRVVTSIKIDDRRDKKNSIKKKKNSVNQKLKE